MKKISILILSLIVCATSGFAQIDKSKQKANDGFGQNRAKTEKSANKGGVVSNANKGGVGFEVKHYDYEFSIGPRLGLGMTSMSESDGFSVGDGGKMGFGGGLAANVRFGSTGSRGEHLDGQGLLGIGVEFNYKQHSVKIKGNDDLSLGCLEIPVMLQLYPMYNSKQLKNLYIELGATISTAMSKSPDKLVYENNVDETIGNTHHTLYEKTTYPTKDLKGMDVKATIGVGYRFNKMSANDGFYMNARYYLGTSKLAGNFPGKISSAELSIGYMFQCVGTKKSASRAAAPARGNQPKVRKRTEF